MIFDATKVTADHLRVMGYWVPDHIPDRARIPLDAVRFSDEYAGLEYTQEFTPPKEYTHLIINLEHCKDVQREVKDRTRN